jgi:hypothetical protein
LALRSNSVREENFQLFSILRFARQLKLIIGFRSCLNAGDSVVDIIPVIGLLALSTLLITPCHIARLVYTVESIIYAMQKSVLFTTCL